MHHRRMVTIAKQAADGRIRQVGELANDIHRSLTGSYQGSLSTLATNGLMGDSEIITDVTQQLAGQLGTLAIEHLPADDLAAVQILKQVQIEVLAAHLSGQIGDVPTDDLIGLTGYQSPWLAALCGARSKRRWANWPSCRSILGTTGRWRCETNASLRGHARKKTPVNRPLITTPA